MPRRRGFALLLWVLESRPYSQIHMKRLLVCTALLTSSALLFQDISNGHGGSYKGPGDTVPPGGGGGGGGGSGPTGSGPGGPTTGNPSNPNGPYGPGAGPTTGGGGSRPGGPSTGPGGDATDLTTWEFWWGFNQSQYLNLKAAIFDNGPTSDSDTYFISGARGDLLKSRWKPTEAAIREKVVPALLKALETERSRDIVTGCLIALGKIGDVKNGEDGTSQFQVTIARFLSDPNQEIAETAAVALGILADESSIEILAELARDSKPGREKVGTTEVTWRTRAFATYGLGLIGNRTAKNEVRQQIARVLMGLLEAPDMSTRDVKVAALIALGLVPVDVDSGENVEAQTDHAASRQTQIAYVKRLFLDPRQNYLLRAHAPRTLAKLLRGAPSPLKDDVARMLDAELDPHAKGKKDEILQSCVLALGVIADAGTGSVDAAVRKDLMRFSDEGDQQSRHFCMIALAQIGGRGRGESFEAGRQDVRNFLLTKLTKGASRIKPWAGLAVGVMERELLDDGQIASTGAIATLLDAFKDAGQPDRVGAWSIGLGIARYSGDHNLVLSKMKETSEVNAKGYLCLSLGLMGARECMAEMRDVVRDSKYKPDLIKQAAIGLGLLGDKDLVPELIAMLSESKTQAVQASVATALGFIGDSRSIDPLVAMLESKVTDSARGFAAAALGIVADKEMLPWNSKVSIDINYRANTTTLTGENGTGILDIL